MTYRKEGPACGRIPYDPTSSEADCEYPLDGTPPGSRLTGSSRRHFMIKGPKGHAFHACMKKQDLWMRKTPKSSHIRRKESYHGKKQSGQKVYCKMDE